MNIDKLTALLIEDEIDFRKIILITPLDRLSSIVYYTTPYNTIDSYFIPKYYNTKYYNTKHIQLYQRVDNNKAEVYYNLIYHISNGRYIDTIYTHSNRIIFKTFINRNIRLANTQKNLSLLDIL